MPDGTTASKAHAGRCGRSAATMVTVEPGTQERRVLPAFKQACLSDAEATIRP